MCDINLKARKFRDKDKFATIFQVDRLIIFCGLSTIFKARKYF